MELARTILTQLKKKLCKRIPQVECEEEEDMAKVLEFNKTDENQSIDKRVSKRSPATILTMTMTTMTTAK